MKYREIVPSLDLNLNDSVTSSAAFLCGSALSALTPKISAFSNSQLYGSRSTHLPKGGRLPKRKKVGTGLAC